MTTGSAGSTPGSSRYSVPSGTPATLARRWGRRAEGLSLTYGRPPPPATPATGSSGMTEGRALAPGSPLASRSTGVMGVEIPTGSLDLVRGAEGFAKPSEEHMAVPRPVEMARWAERGGGLGIALSDAPGGVMSPGRSSGGERGRGPQNTQGESQASRFLPAAAARPAGAGSGRWNGRNVVFDTTTGELGIPSHDDPSALEKVLGTHPAFAHDEKTVGSDSKGKGKAELPASNTIKRSKIPRPIKAPSHTSSSLSGPVTPITTTFTPPNTIYPTTDEENDASSLYDDYKVSPLDPKDPFLNSKCVLNRSPVSPTDPDEEIASPAVDFIGSLNASTPSPTSTSSYVRTAFSHTSLQSLQSAWSSDSDESQPRAAEAKEPKKSRLSRASFTDLRNSFSKFGSAGRDRKRHLQKLETIDETNTSSTNLISKTDLTNNKSSAHIEKLESSDQEAINKNLTSSNMTSSRQRFNLPALTIKPTNPKPHPNHPFDWHAQKLHCAVHQHECTICGKLCCEEERLKTMLKYDMAGMEHGGKEGIDKKLEKLWSLSKEGEGIEKFDTFLHCGICGKKVCPQCCWFVQDGPMKTLMCKLCGR
ncbi:hypothetical protein BDZ85DRAFT_261820 [Elsinoe ampelina]|uniref:Uncharacterized protein n=1 Tax=Elsinoe ampelina TaxID=302913 RepID=A0A6A6GD25_9PEZI|nr:hypothetical protein BDZ85DRAFT_261820 [Elsinoe ampelina]